MIFLRNFLVLSFVLAVQSTLLQFRALQNVHPDFIIIILVILSLRYGPVSGLYLGFCIGLVQDVYAIETLGANVLAKCCIGYFVGLFDETHFKTTLFTRLLFMTSAFIFHDVIYFLAFNLNSRAFFMVILEQSLDVWAVSLIAGSVVLYLYKPGNKAEF